MRRNCPTEGWVQGKSFGVDISIERLHVIYITLKIAYDWKKQHSTKHKYNTLNTRS